MHHESCNKKIPAPKTLHATRCALHGNAGFTLIETFVAITVLLMAVAAPLTLGSQGLTASRIARDQVTGTYLIQEAIEYVRNARDTNILEGDDWLEGVSDCVDAECTIDIPDNEITVCGKECPPLEYNDSLGLYGYGDGSDWEETKFTRSVTLGEFVSATEAQIVVTVSWQDGLVARTIEVDESILNWQ
ncbi:MAG: hypothetical protein KBD16_02915 [Candidatus Pacebacteria bacterium]|nr:hypothetical protein [Candidatus Paceibacterota bacterium]